MLKMRKNDANIENIAALGAMDFPREAGSSVTMPVRQRRTECGFAKQNRKPKIRQGRRILGGLGTVPALSLSLSLSLS
jgi:hypothetical protein